MEWINIAKGETTEIDINGTIGGGFFEDGVTSEQVRADIQELTDLEATKIFVNIESLGGSVQHALAIHDLLASHKAEVEVKITGLTASAATIIAMAGDKITMSDNALFLIHRVSSIAIGDAEDMETAASDMRKIEDRLINIYAKRTGRKEKTIRNLINENKGDGIWLTAEEAKSKGFVDEIFEPTKMAAQITEEELINFKLPIIPKMNTEVNEENKNILETLKAEFKAFKESFNKPEETNVVDFEAKFNEVTETLATKETELANAAENIQSLEAKVAELTEEKTKTSETVEKFENRIKELENLSIGEEIEAQEEGTTEPVAETTEDFVIAFRNEQLKKHRKVS